MLASSGDCPGVISEHLAPDFLDDLTAGLRLALREDLVALYLYGSAVAGGFDPGVSDIDLLVVTAHSLDSPAVRRLGTLHRRTVEQRPEWDNRLELLYVDRGTLARFRGGGRLGIIHPGEPFHLRDGVELWLPDFYVAREAAITLVGPPATVVIPPISWSEFAAATIAYAQEVAGRDLDHVPPGEVAYDVLTLCRALCTIRSERPCSKQEGARWVRARMPEWAWLIDAAERCRLSGGRVGFADAGARSAARGLIARLNAAITHDRREP